MGEPPLRILLVEDEEADYWITRRLLSSITDQTFQMDWLASFAEGLDALEHGSYDVCLVDYRLPDGDGVEFLKESQNRGDHTPIILFTGQGDYRTDLEAMRAGAADYLVKTQLTPALLERSIRYAVDRAQARIERQRVLEELQASELRFRSVVQSAEDAIVLADDQARIIFWNRGAERMFGYSEDEVRGIPLELLMAERYRDGHRIGFDRFRVTGKSQIIGSTIEMEGVRKDGTDFPLELSLGSWSTNEGTFFTAIIRDITERRVAERMHLEKEAAEEANRAKSRFVAKMSHELRTPLNAIVGFAQILLHNKRGNLQPDEVDFVQRIFINARDLLNLINSLLDLSKIEAGRMDLAIGQVTLDTLIDEIVRQIESRRTREDVELRVELPDRLHPVSTDPSKLKQVLLNLVDNALKFTERGTVTVRVITSTMDLAPMRIEVEDTGVGIPKDRLAEIFEPFTQLEHSAQLEKVGTGLGLAISRSLCELMGYRLEVTSNPGRGSTFAIVMVDDSRRMPLIA